jgi:hypothetical protein
VRPLKAAAARHGGQRREMKLRGSHFSGHRGVGSSGEVAPWWL